MKNWEHVFRETMFPSVFEFSVRALCGCATHSSQRQKDGKVEVIVAFVVAPS